MFLYSALLYLAPLVIVATVIYIGYLSFKFYMEEIVRK